MYLNLIDDLGGKGSAVLTAWRAVLSQLQSILARQGKSWDFEHPVEGCLHFSSDEGYKEQGTNLSTSAEADSCFQTLPVLASHSEGHGEWGEDRLYSELLLYLTGRGTGGECVKPQLYKAATRYHQLPLATHLIFHQDISAGLMNTVAKPGSNANIESWISMIIPVQPLCPWKPYVFNQNKFWPASKTLNSCCCKWCWIFLPRFLAQPPEVSRDSEVLPKHCYRVKGLKLPSACWKHSQSQRCLF